MPAVDAQTGNILMSESGQVAMSPDGHGGSLARTSAQRQCGLFT